MPSAYCDEPCDHARCNGGKPLEPIHLDAILSLLVYSWRDIEFDYDRLTLEERDRITREQFESTVRLMRSRGLLVRTPEGLVPSPTHVCDRDCRTCGGGGYGH